MFFFQVRPFACALRLGAARFALPLAAVVPLLAISSSALADAPVVGVRGWTTGSQTFVRVRPSALTPPVAKLPTNTQLYVWGRFNDWYRVETHDHLFGWVHKQYIKSPRLWKVKVISHFKAKQASDQSATQTLYGTPAELKAYHAQYGGEGAVKGLALKGIYVASPKKAPVRLTRVPKAAIQVKKPVLIARAQPLAPRVTPAQPSRPSVPEDVSGDSSQAQTLGRAPEAMAPVASSLADAVRSWTPAKSAPVVSAPPSRLGEALGQASNRIERGSNSARPSIAWNQTFSAPSRSATAVPFVAPVFSAPAPQSGNSTPLNPVFPGNSSMAPAPRVPVATSTQSAPKALTPQQLHDIAWQNRKRAKEQRWKWLQAKKASEWKLRLAQSQKRAKAAQQRRLWLAKQRENHKTYVATLKAGQRQNLAAKVGLAPKQLPPNVPGQTLAPISPDELLKARDQFLRQNAPQNVTGNTPGSTSPGTPFVPSSLALPGTSGVSPLDDLKGNLNVLLFGSAQQKTQTARDLSASSALEPQDGHSAPAASGAHSSSMPVFAAPAVPAQTRVAVSNVVPLPSNPAPSRGGSPRDRARMAWRSGVANQALSYRGMPYVFGSASPSRGFDCSGLIYFLLRQRGLNPPRTAAGYRTYGTAVGRGQWQTGDLILFANTYKRGISHIGVYLKDGKFVHAASTGKGVRVDSISTGYFASKYWGARRVK